MGQGGSCRQASGLSEKGQARFGRRSSCASRSRRRASVFQPGVRAQKYPTKPVKIIIPFPAGGVDRPGRPADRAEAFRSRLGQQFLHREHRWRRRQSRHGAGRARAGRRLHRAASSSSVHGQPEPLQQDAVRRGEGPDRRSPRPAARRTRGWSILSFPAKTMNELIELFKKEPGKYSVGSPGAGTTPSLSIELLKHDLKVDFVTVPFAGGGPMTSRLLGGHVPIACGAIGNSVALIKDGKLRALGVTAKRRLETLPDVPTLDESGIKDRRPRPMTGCSCSGRHAQADRRSAAKGDRQDREVCRTSSRSLSSSASCRWATPRGVRGLREGRHRQVEAGDRAAKIDRI